MASNSLTQLRLKSLLHYDPDTGIFTCVGSRKGAKPNKEAGTLERRGYRHIVIDYEQHQSHRLAFLYMTGSFPDGQIDHVNGVCDDNRWCNLRVVSPSENRRNSKLSVTNKSGVMGVWWDESRQKWVARIKYTKGNQLHIINMGRYRDKFEAICARKSAELKYNFHPNHGRKI